MKKTAGLTLIELLVVIVAVSLPIALPIPVLGAAKEQGQRAVCPSNLSQRTLAYPTEQRLRLV